MWVNGKVPVIVRRIAYEAVQFGSTRKKPQTWSMDSKSLASIASSKMKNVAPTRNGTSGDNIK